MQSNKASKKTSKIVETTAAPMAEKAATAERKAEPRTSKSSKTKNEGTEMTSGKRHHKVATVAPSEPVATGESTIYHPLKGAPAHTVHRHQVAELAYFLWIERGCVHGYAEEDWLRAEQTLAS